MILKFEKTKAQTHTPRTSQKKFQVSKLRPDVLSKNKNQPTLF